MFHAVTYCGFALEKSGSQDHSPIGAFSAGFLVRRAENEADLLQVSISAIAHIAQNRVRAPQMTTKELRNPRKWPFWAA